MIGLLASATATMQTFPQGFSSLFNKPVIGIITKVDLVTDPTSLEKARAQLRATGAKEIFEVSLEDNTGIEAIQNYLTKES